MVNGPIFSSGSGIVNGAFSTDEFAEMVRVSNEHRTANAENRRGLAPCDCPTLSSRARLLTILRQ